MADTTPANDLADPKLLSKIDKFFELGIGEYVALPQLLVVGDQSRQANTFFAQLHFPRLNSHSSGKSSVLEGLTGLPFPRDSGLCTRFATQITFRRNSITKISISVIPAENATAEYADKLRNWRKDDLPSFEAQALAEVLSEVQELMGLGKPATTAANANKTFADDVLRIEISGAEQQHLSIIDVPGIFKKTTPGVTSKTDMAMVRNMVSSYMQNPRSVILAVIPANVDIATQEILDMAEEYDRKGQRTLGVLTKPDLVDRGAEQGVVDIVNGKSHPLNLGWCIVRNPGQQALADKSSDRHVIEKHFFKTQSPWTTAAPDRLGIEALRTRLVEILGEMIRNEFPRVKAEINQKLKFSKMQLQSIGPSRSTREQQFQYLLGLANRFQTITALALRAHYGGDEIFESKNRSSLKLATAVVSRNAAFAEDVQFRGHTIAFEKGDKDETATQAPTNPSSFIPYANQVPTPFGGTTSNVPKTTNFGALAPLPQPITEVMDYVKSTRCKSGYPELEDITFQDEKIAKPKADDIKKWLKEVYTSSRGFELGTFDASILPIVWKKQSSKWDALAMGYISDIVSIVHGFTQDLLRAICTDERILQGINDVLLDHLVERYKKAIEHTKFVLSVERSGTPLTMNHYFTDNLEKSRNARTKLQLQKDAYWDPGQQSKIVKLDSIISSKSNASNEQSTIDDLHDILKAYYKVARKRFVDVVCMQAADFHLVTGPDAPTKVFSPTFVGGLTTEQLEMIAGEDLLTKRKRSDLSRKIENLELGRKIALT